MYSVITSQAGQIKSFELWADHLRAIIRRDVINSKCDEFCGALVMEKLTPDVEEVEIKPITIKHEQHFTDGSAVYVLEFAEDTTLTVSTSENSIDQEKKEVQECLYKDPFTGEEIEFKPASDLKEDLETFIESIT